MKFAPSLQQARLIRRYKRFLADVHWGGQQVTVHCANTGRMLGCDRADSRVWLSHHISAKRKYPWTWELVEAAPGTLVGVNPMRANALVAEAWAAGRIAALSTYTDCQREVTVADGRLDFRFAGENGADHCYMEVKSVTAAEGEVAFFPDAVSVRARRHLQALVKLHRAGQRAALLFCVQRSDVSAVRPAVEIDPDYAIALGEAIHAGVEVMAYRCEVTPQGVELNQQVELTGIDQ